MAEYEAAVKSYNEAVKKRDERWKLCDEWGMRS